jgi:hypothetical protein
MKKISIFNMILGLIHNNENSIFKVIDLLIHSYENSIFKILLAILCCIFYLVLTLE